MAEWPRCPRSEVRMVVWCCVLILFLKREISTANNASTAPIITGSSGPLAQPEDDAPLLVEDLMYEYKSDKSRDDHGYTKAYNLLFGPIRHSIENMTEVGISMGQSLQAWYRMFPRAEIHGIDRVWHDDKIRRNMEQLKPRVHCHIVNIVDPRIRNLYELGFLPESMDLIIDDGPHTVRTQEVFLAKLFPILKPGGMYIIEDVGPLKGLDYFHENPSKLQDETRTILETNDAIWIDAALGHRAWDEWMKRSGTRWVTDRIHHNSYLIVIQKRKKPVREPMQMNNGDGAMEVDGIVLENENGED